MRGGGDHPLVRLYLTYVVVFFVIAVFMLVWRASVDRQVIEFYSENPLPCETDPCVARTAAPRG